MRRRLWKLSALALLSLAGLAGCVAGGYGVGVGYDAGYYEPEGYGYCCWGPGYWVGPGFRRARRGFTRRRRTPLSRSSGCSPLNKA
jgi:hypothetical protein